MSENSFDWKVYESITKYIYETLGKEFGVKVIGYGNDCKVLGKSGVEHQIDVLTSHSDGMHSYRTAIECKYWKDKVNKDIIMKVSKIIEDAGIEKGIIVSKNGFTEDTIAFAKYCNIGLVELREIQENDTESKKEFEIGTLEINVKTTIRRPEILKAVIEHIGKPQIETQKINIYNSSVKLASGEQIPFMNYISEFQDYLHSYNKPFEIVTYRYNIPTGSLIDNTGRPTLNIVGITFTGMLKKIDSNSKTLLSIVDEVWLIMKSIFDERRFSISKTGIITESKAH